MRIRLFIVAFRASLSFFLFSAVARPGGSLPRPLLLANVGRRRGAGVDGPGASGVMICLIVLNIIAVFLAKTK